MTVLVVLILCLSTSAEALCTNKVFCQGKLLHTVQMARIFPDSKTFVDLRMVNDEETTTEKFEQFLKHTKNHPTWKQIKRFVKANFQMVEELETWMPPDFKKTPSFLQAIKNGKIRTFAQELVNIWPTLARRVSPKVGKAPELGTLLPVDHGFIVPGGRFREFYYWDSYWIVKGLLLCEMYETVSGILNNFVFLIEKYGFVPNGARVYYLDRSQPPLLTMMVATYIESTNDMEWLSHNINTLEKELHYFIETKTIEVTKNGVKYTLAHYVCTDGTPRPESYYEDVKTAAPLHTEEDKRKLFANLKSAAESGWDFSSRWIVDTAANLTYTNTARIVPVDLNAFLCQAFRQMFHFSLLLHDYERAMFWLEKANVWHKAVDEVFYHEEDGIWYDWDSELNRPRKMFYASNLVPLWALCYDSGKHQELGRRAVEYLRLQGILEFIGGVPSSLVETGEQWDYPNGWPPLQAIIIQGLENSGDPTAREVAEDLAQKWIESNLAGFYETGRMFEKYDVQEQGEYGRGGEYMVQSGFGWTNGVLLELISRYYTS